MPIGDKRIQFPRGYERSIRNRLGLGQIQQINIRSVLELVAVHRYNWRRLEIEHWEFVAPEYYTVYTGSSKSGLCTQDFDLGVDSDGTVTHIVENRSYPPDFGICDIVANLFKFGTKDKDRDFVVEEAPQKTVEFPKGKEKKIRQILGLADGNCFMRRDILRLAEFHGYVADTCVSESDQLFRISPRTSKNEVSKPSLDLLVDNDETVRSIVAIV